MAKAKEQRLRDEAQLAKLKHELAERDNQGDNRVLSNQMLAFRNKVEELSNQVTRLTPLEQPIPEEALTQM
jgi:hypothetical protein